MIITSRNLLRHLLAKRLVSNESIVDGDLVIVDASGRNRNFKVLRKNYPSLFVKQIRNWDTQAIAMLQCEAACYWLARHDRDFSALEPIIPELYDFDKERQILVTAFIDGDDLWEHLRGAGKISTAVASELGRCFGVFHREAGDRLLTSSYAAVFPKQIPWILSSERRNSHPFKELSPATAELFNRVDESSRFVEALDELRSAWRVSTLMHGDMRLENCILVRDGSVQFKIVDWELADLGDPCWDVGSIIQAMLSAHVISLPSLAQQLTLSALLTHASLPNLPQTIRSFWQSYVRELSNDSDRDHSLAERCVSYGAARMVQSAYEYMQFSPHLSANALNLIEVSSDILVDPRRAAEQLFR